MASREARRLECLNWYVDDGTREWYYVLEDPRLRPEALRCRGFNLKEFRLKYG